MLLMQSLGKIKKIVKKKFKAQGHMDRYKHTLGVVKMAKLLAKRYTVYPKKAMIAAYLHDICKYDSHEIVASLIRPEDIKECVQYPVLYHSYAAAELYLKEFGDDLDIYHAIRNHVFGRLYMSQLEEILLISDYTEENRTYPNCILCREILLAGNLNKAIYKSTECTIEFLKTKNLEPHPLQIEVLKYYEGKC